MIPAHRVLYIIDLTDTITPLQSHDMRSATVTDPSSCGVCRSSFGWACPRGTACPKCQKRSCAPHLRLQTSISLSLTPNNPRRRKLTTTKSSVFLQGMFSRGVAHRFLKEPALFVETRKQGCTTQQPTVLRLCLLMGARGRVEPCSWAHAKIMATRGIQEHSLFFDFSRTWCPYGKNRSPLTHASKG